MNEQTPEVAPQEIVEVAPAPVEVAPEPVQEQVVEQAPPPAPAEPTIDFSDLTEGYVPLFAPEPEPEYVAPQFSPEQIAELVAQKLAQQQPAPQEVDPYAPEEAPMTRKEFMELMAQQQKAQQEQAQAFQIINHHKAESEKVTQKYVQKLSGVLEQYGVDLKADPEAREIIDGLFKAKKTEMAVQKGRLFTNPQGQVMEPVFTAPEMAELVKGHFDIVSKTFLRSKSPISTQTTAPLSAALNSNPGEALPAPAKDAYQQFMEKKASGKETLSDAIALLNKIPMERKTRRS